uniref:G_PROTEIN_RECEP_F1_2 domain-containing protein n=1 Tax=Elaeophora elaphi TaxID=1147741 RepID=A0A0R3RJR6_9BILA
MISQSLCSILLSGKADLDDAATSVYFAKFILNGTSDAIRVSLVNRITYGYIAPVIISFGIIGDIMTVATLTRSLFKRSSIIYTYLILLAITDLSTLLSVIPMILWLLDCRLCSYPSALYYAHIGFPLVNAFMGTSVWIVVFLTMSQYMAVCHPFHHRYLRTRKMCVLLVIISYVMNFCIYAPWAVKKVLYEVPPEIASCRFVVCDRRIEMWYKVYEWCRETISRLLPFVLVAYFNSKILITYRSTKKERFQRLASNQQKISTKSGQEEKQLFTLLFSIIIIFFICTIPAAPLTIFVSDKRSFNVSFQIIRAIINVMEFTKFALNFYFYCLINPNIRLICFHMIRCRPMKNPPRILGQSMNPVSQYTKRRYFSAYNCKTINGSVNFSRYFAKIC